MKKLNLLYLFLIAGLMLGIQSCQKDRFELDDAPAGAAASINSIATTSFNSFGEKLEEAFSTAMTNQMVKISIMELTKDLPTGDYEVLLSTLLNLELKGADQGVKAAILTEGDGLFTEAELDQFVTDFPATIVAVRGPWQGWASEDNVPPVLFVPADLDDDVKQLTGLRNGVAQDFSAEETPDHAVITIQLSERHDNQGRLIGTLGEENVKSMPSVNLSDNPTSPDAMLTCVEPTSCPSGLVTINSFDASIVNNAIWLSWDVDVPAGVCADWVKIRITRTNPNGSIWTLYSTAGGFPGMYDNSATPNTQFTYTMQAYVAYLSDVTNDWVTCPRDNAGPVTIESPGFAEPHESFVGQNMNNTTIRYQWLPPENGASEYKLSAWNDNSNSFQQIAILNGNTFAYNYTHPTSLRGDLVTMKIQHRASTYAWQGDFVDQSYASFRNPNEPLYFHGMNVPNWEELEQSTEEHWWWGAPEFRVITLQSRPNGSAVEVSHIVTPTERCRIIVGYITRYFMGYAYQEPIVSHTTFFRPTTGPLTLLNQWDNALFGTKLNIHIHETDLMEVTTTSTTTTTTTSGGFSLTLKDLTPKIFGSKVKKLLSFGLGVKSEWSTTEKVTITYPTSDHKIFDNFIHYHDERELIINGAAFGASIPEDDCHYAFPQ